MALLAFEKRERERERERGRMSEVELKLHDAARRGDLNLLRQVLAEGEPGSEINGRDKFSRTPLHLASWAGHTEVVEELLKEEGVNVGTCAKDETCAIHFACMKGHTTVARRLLAKGANVNAKTRKGVTPLMMAAQQGVLPLVEVLLKKKADPLIRSKKGESALDVAKNTSVYDLVKEASEKAKEDIRKGGATEKTLESDTKKIRKEIHSKNDAHHSKTKKQKVIALSHLDEDE